MAGARFISSTADVACIARLGSSNCASLRVSDQLLSLDALRPCFTTLFLLAVGSFSFARFALKSIFVFLQTFLVSGKSVSYNI